MGRTEPSVGRPPPGFRKNQRAKKARDTLNKTIPALLAKHARAKEGIAAAELILKPSATGEQNASRRSKKEGKGKRAGKKSGRRRTIEDEEEDSDVLAGEPGILVPRPEQEPAGPPNVTVLVTDTLAAATILNRSSTARSDQKRTTLRKNTAILNMASPLRPGGGFLSGATSQEEFLCMRTTLYPSLREEFYRLPELGAVWSPDVLVFRDSTADASDLPQHERFWVDVISAAALRFPEIELRWHKARKAEGEEKSEDIVEHAYADQKDADLLRKKMKALLRILRNKGTEQVVLGAWGCGAYGNPIGENARAWKEVLFGSPSNSGSMRPSNRTARQEKWYGLKEVVFAINQPKMADEFVQYWGAGLKVETPSTKGEYEDEDDDLSPQESQDVEELRIKIAQLESQITNVNSPVLKSGLDAVLGKLMSELDSKTDPTKPHCAHCAPSSEEDENDSQNEDG